MILAAAVLAGVTGCADRANNLETYYDKPGNAAGSPSAAAPAPASPSDAALNQSAVSTANQIAAQVINAVLTQTDLAREGVHQSTTRASNGACFNTVPAGDPRGASWSYH